MSRHRAWTAGAAAAIAAALISCSSSTSVAPLTTPPKTPPRDTTPASPASLAVRPIRDTLRVDSAVQLTDTVRDAHGNPMAGQTITWKSSAPTIASVSSSGKVTAVAAGSAIITATAGSALGQAAIVVSPPDTAPTPPQPVNLTGRWLSDTITLPGLAGAKCIGVTQVEFVIVQQGDTLSGWELDRRCGEPGLPVDTVAADTGSASTPCLKSTCKASFYQGPTSNPVWTVGGNWQLQLSASADTLRNVTPVSVNHSYMPTLWVRQK